MAVRPCADRRPRQIAVTATVYRCVPGATPVGPKAEEPVFVIDNRNEGTAGGTRGIGTNIRN